MQIRHAYYCIPWTNTKIRKDVPRDLSSIVQPILKISLPLQSIPLEGLEELFNALFLREISQSASLLAPLLDFFSYFSNLKETRYLFHRFSILVEGKKKQWFLSENTYSILRHLDVSEHYVLKNFTLQLFKPFIESFSKEVELFLTSDRLFKDWAKEICIKNNWQNEELEKNFQILGIKNYINTHLIQSERIFSLIEESDWNYPCMIRFLYESYMPKEASMLHGLSLLEFDLQNEFFDKHVTRIEELFKNGYIVDQKRIPKSLLYQSYASGLLDCFRKHVQPAISDILIENVQLLVLEAFYSFLECQEKDFQNWYDVNYDAACCFLKLSSEPNMMRRLDMNRLHPLTHTNWLKAFKEALPDFYEECSMFIRHAQIYGRHLLDQTLGYIGYLQSFYQPQAHSLAINLKESKVHQNPIDLLNVLLKVKDCDIYSPHFLRAFLGEWQHLEKLLDRAIYEDNQTKLTVDPKILHSLNFRALLRALRKGKLKTLALHSTFYFGNRLSLFQRLRHLSTIYKKIFLTKTFSILGKYEFAELDLKLSIDAQLSFDLNDTMHVSHELSKSLLHVARHALSCAMLFTKEPLVIKLDLWEESTEEVFLQKQIRKVILSEGFKAKLMVSSGSNFVFEPLFFVESQDCIISKKALLPKKLIPFIKNSMEEPYLPTIYCGRDEKLTFEIELESFVLNYFEYATSSDQFFRRSQEQKKCTLITKFHHSGLNCIYLRCANLILYMPILAIIVD